MKIYETLDFQMDEECIVAIGKFEGLHLGHKLILNELIQLKNIRISENSNKETKTAVFTFYPGPDVFFSKDIKGNMEIIGEKEKAEALEEMGIDYLVRIPFDEHIANMSAEQFLSDILVSKLNAKVIVSGSDVSFGRNCAGNAEFLQANQEKCGYEAKICQKLELNGKEVSSSLIRSCLMQGKMEEAKMYMGFWYHLDGEVLGGRKLGRTFGYPTCNISQDEQGFIPPFGVYYTYVYVGGEKYSAMTNVGVRPTVSVSGRISVESFILNYDLDRDIYGENVRVEFLHYSRPEQRFENVDALTEQLKIDERDANIFFETLL